MTQSLQTWPMTLSLMLTVLAGQGVAQKATSRSSQSHLRSGKKTALDAYVAKPDKVFGWKEVRRVQKGGLSAYVLDLKSQAWRSQKDVDRPVWQHWLHLILPDKPVSDTALLFITGGGNGRKAPMGPSGMMVQIAMATQCIVAQLQMVPNQPLKFGGDGQDRYEDDLIGYTWNRYLETGDATWAAQLPMAKSAVRAMDVVQAFVQKNSGGKRSVHDFVVTGASKRGWTTWLTAAVDSRVRAIVPIVIDVLNVDPSMRHHFAAYGFWAPAVGDYVRHGIMAHMNDPRLKKLYEVVDPFAYRDRLTMPKLILNASGDQFFLPDSSRFYFDQLPGEKHLRYVPNVGHGLRGSDAIRSLTTFFAAIATKKPRPEFSWTFEKDGSIRVICKTKPREVKLWRAHNEQARDFRKTMVDKYQNAYKATPLEASDDGTYIARLRAPEKGWSAAFVELTFDLGPKLPLKLTTAVRILPDTLPFADKDPTSR